jgi:hypothetical protein
VEEGGNLGKEHTPQKPTTTNGSEIIMKTVGFELFPKKHPESAPEGF